jgi:putative spermidine/putrescine transport system ATP-binding protein
MTIALDEVSFSYGASGASISALSLHIGEGELMAMIGPSGCGKSTVLKLIAGFLTPSAGTIAIAGQPMGATAPKDRDLGVVFQSYALFPHMTLADNVGYSLKLRRIAAPEAGKRVAEALAMVGLSALADRYPRSLSGGQQQRVALARALVFRPRALLLDEPLSALDAAMRAEMRDEIRRLQRHHGIATLHITHDQEEALSMADRVAVMRAGALLQVATPRELYQRPASHEVAAFVGHANLHPGKVLDRHTVRLAWGDLACAPHGFQPGSAVSALIRPEAIVPHAREGEGGSAQTLHPGAVRRDRFLGSLRRLDFALADGPTLLVETAHADIQPTHIELPPDAVQVIAPARHGAGKSAQDHPSAHHPPASRRETPP